MKNKDTLKINQNNDGSFTAEWDKQDPEWSLNNFTSKEYKNYSVHLKQKEKMKYHLYDEELYSKGSFNSIQELRNFLCDRKYE